MSRVTITVDMSPAEYDAYREFQRVTMYETFTPHATNLPDNWLRRYAEIQASDTNYVAAAVDRDLIAETRLQ